MRTDLLTRMDEIVRREPVDAAEGPVEHSDHVDDEPNEDREHAAKDDMGCPTEVEQPQD